MTCCRWWSGSKCEEFKEMKTSQKEELDLQNIGGVFIVLAFGIGASMIVCFVEVFLKKMRKKKSKVRAAILFSINENIILYMY